METSVDTGSMDMGAESSAPIENDNQDAAIENEQGSEEKKEAPKEVQSFKKKLKLKVDGEEIEDEIDFNDEEGLKRKLQLSYAAKKRMEEAKAAKSKAFEIIKAFEEDPANVFKKLGPKGREAAERFLLEQIQEEMLDPKDKELRDLKKFKEEIEKERETQKEAAKRKELEAQEARYADEFQKTIISALDKSGLPKSPESIKRMAQIMSKNLELGLELTPDELALEVKNDMQGMLKSFIKDATGDQLVAMFGEDIANRIRKFDIQKLQEKQSGVFGQKPKQEAQAPRPKSNRPMTMDEWKASLEERIK